MQPLARDTGMRIRSTPCWMLIVSLLFGQKWIEGSVMDSTGDPLPFVSVRNLQTGLGTYTDLQGHFRIAAGERDTLEFRCIGYQTLRILASALSSRIILAEAPIEVAPITIRPGENPAHALIRRLQAHASRWNPLSRPHTYTSYNKLTISLPDTLRNDSLPPYLFLWETETEKSYYSPSRQTETLLSQKITGNLPVQSFLSPTSFLPLSLYEADLRLMERRLISPAGPDALRFYEYAVEDTIYAGGDTLIRVSFFPRRGREAWCLRGQMTIALPDAALANLQGETDYFVSQNGIIQVAFYRIWHYYEKLGDSLWFPTQLHSEVGLQARTSRGLSPPLFLRSRSFLQSIRLLSAEERPSQSVIVLTETPRPLSNRAEPLTPEEAASYTFMDSVLAKMEIRRLKAFLDLPNLISARISVGYLNLILRPLLLYHEAEGLRPQLGIETNDRLSQRWRLRGWLGYGTYRWASAQGTPWRYGAEIEVGKLTRLRAFAYDDVREATLSRLLDESPIFLPGEQRPYEVPVRAYSLRWEAMLRERAAGFSLRFPLLGQVWGYSDSRILERKQFDRQWQGIASTIGIEYLYRQTLIRRGGLTWRAEYELPRLHLQIGGLRDWNAPSPLSYWLQADFLHKAYWGRWAVMRLRLSAFHGHKLPLLWQHRLRSLPDLYLGSAYALAAHPLQKIASTAFYAFYEWSIPNSRFPTRNWSPVLTFHLQGAYTDKTLYPEGGVSLQSWLPNALLRLFPSLSLTRIGVFFPLVPTIDQTRAYWRISSSLF